MVYSPLVLYFTLLYCFYTQSFFFSFFFLSLPDTMACLCFFVVAVLRAQTAGFPLSSVFLHCLFFLPP